MEEYLSVIEQFFDTDFELKKMMAELAPSSMDSFDEESKIKYYSRLYKILQYAKTKLSFYLQSDFFRKEEFSDTQVEVLEDGTFNYGKKKNNVPETFYKRINEIKSHLISLESTLSSPEQAYRECFSGMSKGLVDNVRRKFFGENENEMTDLAETMEETTTINELLHVLHTHLENSNRILGSVPIIDKIEITAPHTNQVLKSLLLGEPDNELARSIFDLLPVKTRYAYVVGLKDKTLLMVRDVGHALTMQIIEGEDGQYNVNYFIPKVTNADDIVKLPVEQQTLDYNNGIAYGQFTLPKDNAAQSICSFIDMIPGDEGISSKVLKELIFIRGDLEKAMGLVNAGVITPRNLLLYSNFAGINVDDELRTKLLSLAEDLDKDNNSAKKDKNKDKYKDL